MNLFFILYLLRLPTAVVLLALTAGGVTAQVRGPLKPPTPPVVAPKPTPSIKPPSPPPPRPTLAPAPAPKPNIGPRPTPPVTGVVKPSPLPRPTPPSNVKPNPGMRPQPALKPTPRPAPVVKPSGPYSVLPQHHTWPWAMGNNMPRGSYGLSPLSPANHQAVHRAMEKFFASNPKYWKVTPSGQRVNIYPLSNQPKGSSVQHFSLKDRYRALESFYRQYQGGKLLDNFRAETGRAWADKKLK